MTLPHFGIEDCRSLAESYVKPYHENYFAMYSSVLGGVVTHPFLMTVPMDDHIVHRGDGVFEVFKCVDGKLYNLHRHLERLERSARALYLRLPVGHDEMVNLIVETIRIAAVKDCLVRLFVSRGPGGFTTNPYECPRSQLYIVACSLISPAEEVYRTGVSAKSSSIPSKKSYFANIKSCNYLPNVLMKKEAVDMGVDFTISLDDNGFLGEGSTENIGVVSRDGRLRFPKFSRILQGTTVTRVAELAQPLVEQGALKEVLFEDITLSEAYSSSEMLLFGTTFDILAITTFDGHTVGTGKPGPVFHLLKDRLDLDIQHNSALHTVVYPE
ncbi:MAG: aminotransferase class IV [Deltaproteobacteria bacterium]|nr:aminotransferase class IV [Deltaproteobacteria bacterium]MBW2069960.1 aminotransferase class IV [Deltaproteobacteria bacterium]